MVMVKFDRFRGSLQKDAKGCVGIVKSCEVAPGFDPRFRNGGQQNISRARSQRKHSLQCLGRA